MVVPLPDATQSSLSSGPAIQQVPYDSTGEQQNKPRTDFTQNCYCYALHTRMYRYGTLIARRLQITEISILHAETELLSGATMTSNAGNSPWPVLELQSEALEMTKSGKGGKP